MVAVRLTLAVWVAFELGLRVWETAQGRGRLGHDQWTRALIGVTAGASVGGAFALRAATPALRIGTASSVAGVIVMWIGLGLRAWAVACLGRSFRTTVEVASGQAVVSTGPYRWVRHPSYTGLLLIVLGCGLGAADWASVALAAVLPLPGVLRRIRVEEAELGRVLGAPYAAYEARTARLIPGVW